MFRLCVTVLVLVLGPASRVSLAVEPKPTSAPSKGDKVRTFLFTYAASVEGIPAGKVARIWLPVPPSNEDQQVKMVSKDLPNPGRLGRESKYGNQILYVEAKAPRGRPLSLSVTYQVTRREIRSGHAKGADDPKKVAEFLKPDAKVPVGGKPMELLKGKKVPMDPMAVARLLYDIVDQHMRYSKEGVGWGRGDAVWACDSRYGNCSDFHSLFMSLARSEHIPTKFEIGFPLPEKRGAGEISGYHCWAKFWIAGKGWIPVDISEANKNPKLKDYYFGNLTENRVAFSTGRDLTLVPRQDAGPLNFFVYPYIEVDGKPLAADQVKGKFTFRDVKKAER